VKGRRAADTAARTSDQDRRHEASYRPALNRDVALSVRPRVGHATTMTDAFHPDLPRRHPNLRHVGSGDLDPETAQTSGMQRFAAISNGTVGSERLWMGQTHVGPASRSGDHHHGEAETAIYVLSGTPEFVFLDEVTGDERRIRARAGDYVFVPPYTPHREENNDPNNDAVVVIARSTQEAIVVNLASLADRPAPES
jgi:uncharacterized RmlC-like cupin family protein